MPQGWHCTGGVVDLCYASPPILASHAGCASTCSKYAQLTYNDGATAGLAYVGSRETTEFLVQHVLGGHRHWIGLHRAAPPQGTEGTTAVQGAWTSWAATPWPNDAPVWTNWAPSQPDAALGREDCVGVDGLGRWHDRGCARAEYRCVCELHARTRPEYFAGSAQLLAVADAEAWATAVFALKAFVALFVPAVLLMLLSARRLRKQLQQRGKQQQKAARRAERSSASSGGSRHAPARVPEQGHATKDERLLRQMDLAHLHYALQRLQSSSLVGVVGLMLLCGGWVPMICQLIVGSWPASTLGPYASYLPLAAVGGITLGLALHPTNASGIRAVARFVVVLWLALSVACALIARSYSSRDEWQIPLQWWMFSLLNLVSAVAQADGLRRHAHSTPRLLLRKTWATGRFLCCTTGFLMGVFSLPLLLRDPVLWQDPYTPGFIATVMCFVCLPLSMTPSVRDRVRTWLGGARWGKGIVGDCAGEGAGELDSEQNILAVSLMKMHPSHSTPEESLEHAKRHFVCCTLDASPLDSSPSGPSAPAKTVAALCSAPRKAKFGAVDAFISHSQLDDEACKWETVRDWARGFAQQRQRAPTVWYDRVCIEEASAAESVATLPLMVMGCKQLVVLAGPTYSSRLWALVEVLVFLWSQQGRPHEIHVLPLLQPAAGAAEGGEAGLGAELALLRSLRRIDLAAAACYCEEDRQWMLAAIESAFGTPRQLNTLLSGLLHSKCSRHIAQQRVDGTAPECMDELPAQVTAAGNASGVSWVRDLIARLKRPAAGGGADRPPATVILDLPPELLTLILRRSVCLESLHARQPRLAACASLCESLQLLSAPLYQALTEATLESLWGKMRMSRQFEGPEVPTVEEALVLHSRGTLTTPELMLTAAESRLLGSQFRHQRMRNLRELHLMGLRRSFGDVGLCFLSEALLTASEPSQLRLLRLRNAGIHDQGAIALARVLDPAGRGDMAPLKHLHSLLIQDNDYEWDGLYAIVEAAVKHTRRWDVRPVFRLDLRPGRNQSGIEYSLLVQRALWWVGHEARLACEYSWEVAGPLSFWF